MTISTDEINREKAELPMGWGRFGTALESLAELSEPDESLVATCITINPDYRHSTGLASGLLSAIQEAAGATNVVVACTDRRVLLVFTGLGGAPRSHAIMPFSGTTIVERGKKEFVLEHDGARMTFRGASKKPAARLLDELAKRL